MQVICWFKFCTTDFGIFVSNSVNAGFGKMICADQSALDDAMSIFALNKDYFTVEPFLENIDFEFRLQQIGKHRRAFRRNSSTSW